ncbi:MAG: metallophosphoesterase family protein [Desulfovibrio sp.]
MIAVISDIHGNSWALQAVLDDIRRKNITDIVNLGDHFYGPLDPAGTYEILKNLDHKAIMGNQDALLLHCTMEERKSNPTLDGVMNALPEEAIQWVQGLPYTDLYKDSFFLCHGTPHNSSTYFIEDVKSGKAIVKSDAALKKLLLDVPHKYVLCGHSHLQQMIRVSTGQMVINSGSVGLQAYSDDVPAQHKMENYTPDARYTILHEIEVGKLTVEHVAVPYDFKKAVQQAYKMKRLDWANALLSGRA